MEIVGIDNVADKMFRNAEALNLSGCVMVALAKVVDGQIIVVDETSATRLSSRITNPEKRRAQFQDRASRKIGARLSLEKSQIWLAPDNSKDTPDTAIVSWVDGLLLIAAWSGTKSRKPTSPQTIVDAARELSNLTSSTLIGRFPLVA